MSREKTRRLPPIEPHRVENIYIYEKLRKREPIASPRAFDPAIRKINKYYALPLPIFTAKKKKKKRRGEKENSLMTMCAPPSSSIPGKKRGKTRIFPLSCFLFFSFPFLLPLLSFSVPTGERERLRLRPLTTIIPVLLTAESKTRNRI